MTTDLPCRRTDPDLFFSTHPSNIQYAKSLCRRCPERDLCRDFARRNREFGIWGGEDEKERTKAGYQPKRDRVAADCGTEAGAAAHRRAGSEPCTGCLAAEGRAHRERGARRAARAA